MNQNRNTKQRQRVLSALKARNDHPSADQIYLDIKSIDSKISRSTVYRNLNVMVKQGDVHQIKISQVDHFEIRQDTHYHLLCIECKSIIDLPLTYQNEFDLVVAKETSYIIHKHHIVFEGICKKCQQKPNLIEK